MAKWSSGPWAKWSRAQEHYKHLDTSNRRLFHEPGFHILGHGYLEFDHEQKATDNRKNTIGV
jgi:hypothetical protein